MATPTTPSSVSAPSKPDATPSAGDKTNAPIGKVSDALHLEGTGTFKEHPEVETGKSEAETDAPITSLAQLRDYQIANNVPAGKRSAQRDEVKKLEEKIAKEGADKPRLSSSEMAKVKTTKK